MDLEPRGPEDGETNYEARDHGALEQQVLALLSIQAELKSLCRIE